MSDFDFDVMIIGSGFGGAVSTYRMAEKGKKVCLIERGKKYEMHSFPRRLHEMKKEFFWDPNDKQFGIMEFRDYQESDLMSVSASGLGGGSLIYANVLMKMPPEYFENWPFNINRDTLEPHYNEVLRMMEASPYPFGTDPYYTDTPKTKVMKEVADSFEQSGEQTEKPQFIFPDLAINFKGEFPGQQSKNIHGAVQSKCNKCGECDLGCNIHAKNTLDLNYIFAAEKKFGATIITEREVTRIVPIEGGYKLTTNSIYRPDEHKIYKTKKVILSAGCLGSNKLLLSMKKEGVLDKISPMLGEKWCGNGDLEGSVLNSKHQNIITKGPTITGAIQYKYSPYPDGFKHGAFIQDAGAPIGLIWYLAGKIPNFKTLGHQIKFVFYMMVSTILRFFGIKKHFEVNIGDMFAAMLDSDDFSQKGFLLLGMGRDRSSGKVELNKNGEPIIKWSLSESRLHYNRVRGEMKAIAEKMEGTFFDNPLTHVEKIIAVHPLGGCAIGESEKEGVVDQKGEVYNYPGLHVIDASIMPTSIGPNPSLTIAALAEYICAQID